MKKTIPHYEIAEHIDNNRCSVYNVSANGNKKKLPFECCSACFTELSVGIFLEGVCVKCGRRICSENTKDLFDEFLDSLDIQEGTRVTYRSLYSSGDKKMVSRFKKWKALNEE